jgi:chromosome partitioning protein
VTCLVTLSEVSKPRNSEARQWRAAQSDVNWGSSFLSQGPLSLKSAPSQAEKHISVNGLFRAYYSSVLLIFIQTRKAARVHARYCSSQKGGSGKTIPTGNVAIAGALAGHGPAVLIDTDPQGSLAAWWNVRKADSPAFASVTVVELRIKLQGTKAAGYELAFVDTPPAIAHAITTAIAQVDLVLIPPWPSPHNLRAAGSTVELVQGQGKSLAFVLTQTKPNSRLMVQTMGALSAHGAVQPAVVHHRIDYAASMIDWRTVQETDPNGRSAAEMAELWELVWERLHERKQQNDQANPRRPCGR